ncbi:MAG: hypothetical protein R2757_12310 [Draconibacterium sp.]
MPLRIFYFKILAGLFSAITGIFGDAFTVILYLIFIMLWRNPFFLKNSGTYPNDEKYKHVNQLIGKSTTLSGVILH